MTIIEAWAEMVGSIIGVLIRVAALPSGVYGIWLSLKDAGVTNVAPTVEHCIAIGLCIYVAAWPLQRKKEED